MTIQLHELERQELLDMLQEIQQALWPDGDEEWSWSPDTLDQIAQVFERRKEMGK